MATISEWAFRTNPVGWADVSIPDTDAFLEGAAEGQCYLIISRTEGLSQRVTGALGPQIWRMRLNSAPYSKGEIVTELSFNSSVLTCMQSWNKAITVHNKLCIDRVRR